MKVNLLPFLALTCALVVGNCVGTSHHQQTGASAPATQVAEVDPLPVKDHLDYYSKHVPKEFRGDYYVTGLWLNGIYRKNATPGRMLIIVYRPEGDVRLDPQDMLNEIRILPIAVTLGENVQGIEFLDIGHAETSHASIVRTPDGLVFVDRDANGVEQFRATLEMREHQNATNPPFVSFRLPPVDAPTTAPASRP